jgi:hypothetical protein
MGAVFQSSLSSRLAICDIYNIVHTCIVYHTLRSPYSWRKMATFPGRFDFLTDLFGKLTYVHHLPRSLFPPGRSEISFLSPALSRRPVRFLFQRSNYQGQFCPFATMNPVAIAKFFHTVCKVLYPSSIRRVLPPKSVGK